MRRDRTSGGRWWSARLLVLVLVVGAAASAVSGAGAVAVARPATATASKATATPKRRCPKGRVALSGPHVRRTCVAAHPSSTQDVVMYRTLGRRLRLRARRHGHGHGQRVAAVLTSTRMLGGVRGVNVAANGLPPVGAPPQKATAARRRPAHASVVQPDHTQQSVSSPDGWSGTLTSDTTTTAPDAGHAGDATVESDSVVREHKGSDQASLSDHTRVSLDACPSADGKVSGTVERSRTISATTATKDGGTQTLVEGWEVHGRIATRTTDQGKIPHFDLDVVYEAYAKAIVRDAKGRTVASSPSGRWTVHLSRTGLHLEKAMDEVLDGNVRIEGASGPSGSWTGGIPRKDLSIAQDGIIKMALAAGIADRRLQWVQSAWQDGACMEADFSSSDLQLSPHLDFDGNPNGGQVGTMADGQTAHLTVTLTRKGGRPLAAGTFSAEVYRSAGADKGQFAPASGGFTEAPLTFTYTAPASGWTKADDEITIAVHFTSHQGQTGAHLDLTPAPTGYELRYTHTSKGSLDYGYDQSSVSGSTQFVDTGHYVESRDVQASAAFRLTQAADGSYSGTGPLRWDRSTWSTEDDNTSNEGQQYPNLCELDDHEAVTAATDGALTVSAMTVGDQPKGSATIAGLGETWHQDDDLKSGNCGDYHHDYARTALLDSIARAQVAGGASPNRQFDGQGNVGSLTFAIDSGWQAGTGDVVATRTISGVEPGRGPDTSQQVPYTDTFQVVRVRG